MATTDDHAVGRRPPRADHRHGGPPHESPAVVTLPLVLLAIPSLVIGFVAIDAMLFGDYFKNVIFVDAARHPAMTRRDVAARAVPRRGGRWRCTDW
jgi:NADH:ubiquinone oxidoreductase subunit 5 (subunit L)/multisubunit Na+/H+ antiporter MnhA subunit